MDLSKIDSSNLTGVSMFDVQNDKNNNKNDNNRVKLGYTVGTPQIGKIRNGKYAAFLASGYAAKQIASQENKTALYVYDLNDTLGTPIAKIEVEDGKGGLSSPRWWIKIWTARSISPMPAIWGGNMYRFDLSDNDPNKWTVRTIFQAQNRLLPRPPFPD
ncbi:pilus assembly protein [Neisseria gonorrhoeae]|nr:pilus assembly protein [Neisseria gonorrhoeae]UXY75801.1 pilus assembly protein [Neisseria gonorrhoeae]